MTKLFSLHQVSLEINNKSIIKNISMDIHDDSISVLMGPNGAGKSSLLRLLAGFTQPTRGNIIRNKILAEKPIGFLFQKSILLNRSVEDNLIHALRSTSPETTDKHISLINNELSKYSIRHLSDISAQKISIGEQQIVSLIRAKITNPSIMLLDEPTSSLDVDYTKRVEDFIKSISHNIKIIMVTHDLNQANRLSKNIINLDNGELK